jgi:pimeloyl-ACP methyl ester carboxylesterase
MAFNPTNASVETEGCDIHYWYQGNGPLLIFVPGGNGIGRQFNGLFPYLDLYSTVCTFDRRQTNLSVVKDGVKKQMNIIQQCRDIIAIIKALGYQRASLFANSGGAVIAFQFSVSYPEYLEHVIAHEAPTTVLLDDTTYHVNRAFVLYDTYREKGEGAAAQAFFTEMKGYKVDEGAKSEDERDPKQPTLADKINFWENEFLTFTIYCPDLRKIVENNVSIAVARGVDSGDAFYARTTVKQAEILGCEQFIFPGHHTGYNLYPEGFAKELKLALQHMEMLKPRWNQKSEERKAIG